MENPEIKLFKFLINSSEQEKNNIKFYTRQKTSDILSRGSQMSEIVNRCLDVEDELDFEDAFKNDIP